MKFVYLAAVAAAFVSAPAVAAPSYLPVGPQTNVALSTVTNGGWVQCFSASYGQFGPTVASVLAGCSGDRLMLAGRRTGSDQLLLLAQAERADVLFEAGSAQNPQHIANGSNWYFSDSWSWGFAPAGATLFRVSCDAQGIFNGDTAANDFRLCWHTGGAQMNSGWRAGSFANLFGDDFEKLIFVAGDTPVPAPAALTLFGLGLLGVALRRR